MDDGQLYVNSLAADVAISQLTACVADVDVWMKANRLCLNAQKMQLIWLGSCQQLEKITATDVQLLSANLQVMSTVRDLGVLIDSRLTMADMSPPSVGQHIISCANYAVSCSH